MRRVIRIENRSAWRTDHLRAFIARAAAIALEDDPRPLYVNVSNGRGARVRGRAVIGGYFVTITLPKSPPKRGLAFILVHEFGHTRGLTHRQMRAAGWDRWWTAGDAPTKTRGGRPVGTYAWADALPLERKTVKEKARIASGVALAERNRALALAGIDRWEAKARRAARALAKLRKRLRYYDKRLAAMTAGPKGPETKGGDDGLHD